MDTPLKDFNAQRSQIVDEVVARVADSTRDPLKVLGDAVYQETMRLRSSGGPELATWQKLAASLMRMSDAERRGKVGELARTFAWDVAGNFDPRVYRMVSSAGAPVLGALLKPRHALRYLARPGDLSALDSRIRVEGPVELVRDLQSMGTVVYVPTHLSNLDSVVFGFALERAGLEPATYGAGKNLFTNPVLSFFMHNLGAYRVDRRIRHNLYKDVLKAYSCVLIERGYHCLFFPGGTRSRSGALESKLKLGLAGTGVEAFARTVGRGRPRRVFFIPATINYLLTLEAETLIDDFLKEEGKARYIIEDDESTRFAKIAAFVRKLSRYEESVVIRFSDPLDPFGNRVDSRGRSIDDRGRVVDARTYLYDRNDVAAPNAARDAQYTRELGERIVQAYERDVVIMSTHLVAAVAFALLRERTDGGDVFSILGHQDDVIVPKSDFLEALDALLRQAKDKKMAGRLVFGPGLEDAAPDVVLARALDAFEGFHRGTVIGRRGDGLVLSDTRLIFYYQNRLAAHGLGIPVKDPRVKSSNKR